jgi:flagellar biosynthetic protein FliR
MPASTFGLADWASTFLLTATRVGGALAFTPIPGIRQAPALTRALLILCVAAVLTPLYPPARLPGSASAFFLWLVNELIFGLAVGLLAGFVAEGLLLAAQAVSLQAGYSFATMVDPNSQADSGVLQIFFTLAANLLFFVCGLHHAILRAFTASLQHWPPGAPLEPDLAEIIIRFGGSAIASGLRLAIPVAGFLLLTDLFLAIAGRMHAQLQLLTLAFPVKMLASLAGLAVLAPAAALLYGQLAAEAIRIFERLLH